MGEKSTFFDKVTNVLLKHNLNLKTVRDLKILKTIPFSKENLDSLQKMLKTSRLNDLDHFREGTMSEEILIIMTFNDDQNHRFATIIYDNDRLWQDEQVLYIYPM